MQAAAESAGRNVLEVVSRRRLVVGITLAIGLILAVTISVLWKYYDGTAHVLLVNDQQGRDPTTEGLDMPEIATSTTVLDKVRTQLHLDMTTDKLRHNVTVRVSPKSSIMTITAKDHRPDTAIAITNAVADTFVAFYSSVASGRYQNVINQLRQDLIARRARILSLETRLQQASSNSSYVGSQASLDNTASALNDLVTQRTFANAQLVSDQASLAASRVQPGQLSKIIRHETLENDQNYRQMEIDVSHDVADLAIRRAGYTDLFPGMKGEVAKVEDENQSLHQFATKAIDGPTAYSPSLAGQIIAEQKAQAAVDGDRARVAALDAQISTTRQQLSDVPKSGMNVGAIRALRDTEEAQYSALALRLSNAQANSAEANSLGSVVVIDRAETAEPYLLGTNLLLALFALVAVGVSIGAGYLAEAVNPRFISPGDVESFYGRPVIGSINAV